MVPRARVGSLLRTSMDITLFSAQPGYEVLKTLSIPRLGILDAGDLLVVLRWEGRTARVVAPGGTVGWITTDWVDAVA